MEKEEVNESQTLHIFVDIVCYFSIKICLLIKRALYLWNSVISNLGHIMAIEMKRIFHAKTHFRT
jgi:hypothetical protein